ncbi:hypothetical protein QE152_g29924 [Popillia japonica]|uniref:Reverse transcriptase domain-containing protein n=1 Tax=Popillia japonica TaxID=7064 RepID=A0AAW1JG37_POPJA
MDRNTVESITSEITALVLNKIRSELNNEELKQRNTANQGNYHRNSNFASRNMVRQTRKTDSRRDSAFIVDDPAINCFRRQNGIKYGNPRSDQHVSRSQSSGNVRGQNYWRS